MATKLTFRQHILLLVIINILMLMFIGASTTNSIIGKFIPHGNESIEIQYFDSISDIVAGVTTNSLGMLISLLFIGFTAVAVTSGSNFLGTLGILAGVFKFGIIVGILMDYVWVYNSLIGGQAFGMLNIIGLIILIPLIVDALFASLDWIRGVQT